MNIYLSIVIPAYNEELRIASTLQEIFAYLAQQSYTAEIIVVDDGSDDRTSQIVAPFCGTIPPVHLLQNSAGNRGKGFSVRNGFLHARGEYLLYSDADLSTPIKEVEKLFVALQEPCDVAIASRALAQSRIEVHQPQYREYMGRLFNILVRILVIRGIRDTQCGFKCFTREAAIDICHRMTLEWFAFDVEMLYLARMLGYRVREVSVVWRDSPNTRIRAFRDSAFMFRDLLRIRWNHLSGRYDLPKHRAPSFHRPGGKPLA